ncbi:MAG: hypothetical protein P8Y64_00565 [Gammaproteobacteria bacterium]|jgi:hypothetical protein
MTRLHFAIPRFKFVLAAACIGLTIACASTVRAATSLHVDDGNQGGENVMDIRGIPADFSLKLLSDGRDIYHDLQRSLESEQNRDIQNTLLYLRAAHDRIGDLDASPELASVRAQTDIIRTDLEDQSKRPAADLWIPVHAELSDVLVGADPKTRARLLDDLRQGQQATSRAERKIATARLNDLLDVIDYRFEVIPLNHVREDVNAALRSATLPEVDWHAVREATRHAIGLTEWLTRSESHGLVLAYYDVVDAYYTWPWHKSRARHDLAMAANDLRKTAGERVLAETASKLATAGHDTMAELVKLRAALLSRIHQHESNARPQAKS